MSKLTIPNQPGHYEGSGFEVNVFAHQIVITSKESKFYDTTRHHAEPKRVKDPEPENMSLLNSVLTIRDRFGKK